MTIFNPPNCCRVCKHLDLLPDKSLFNLEFKCKKNLWWPANNTCKRQEILIGNEIKNQINKFKDNIKSNKCFKELYLSITGI